MQFDHDFWAAVDSLVSSDEAAARGISASKKRASAPFELDLY